MQLDFEEVWKPVIIAGKETSWYSISNYGRLVSHLKKQSTVCSRDSLGRIVKGGSISNYFVDPSYRKDIKFSLAKHKDGTVKSIYKKLHLPVDFFQGTYLENEEFYKPSETTIKYHANAHQLVMWAFRPIDKYPPERLAHCWNALPEDAKQWISECVIINHIKHDPTQNWMCADGPHPQDSLEYCTPGENTRKAKEFYGGNHANKGKLVQLNSEEKLNPLKLLLYS